MRYEFNRMANVEILHRFYQSEYRQDLDILPTLQCKKFMRDYGLLFKKTPNGFALLYETVRNQSNETLPKFPLDRSIKFSFILKAANPYFHNYSNLPFQLSSSHIYRMANMNNNENNNRLLLTSNTNHDSVSEDDAVELKSQSFLYQFSSTNNSDAIKIVDEFNTTVIEKAVEIVDGKFSFRINLKNHPPGLYSLLINGSNQLNFYASDELMGQNVFGVVEIYHHNLVPQAYKFVTENQNQDVIYQTKTYTVTFETRKTFWHYYVVLKYRTNINANDLTIGPIDPNSTLVFNRENNVSLSNGKVAVPFVSNEQLPIQENRIMGIRLNKSNGNNSGVFEIQNLPNASYRQIHVDGNNDLFSKIYVYV